MSLNFQNKQEIISEVNELAKDALSIVIADFSGVTANKMTELRKEGRKSGVYLRVVRNTLMHRLIKGTIYECLKEAFVGQILIAFSKKHPGAAARLFKEFKKLNPMFEIKAAAFGEDFIPANQIDRLADLPTFEEAIIRLMLTMKEASAGKLVCVLAAIRDQKKAA
ncbi:MAG: 50S ribosomal protein L10 [Arsenophonus sp.]